MTLTWMFFLLLTMNYLWQKSLAIIAPGKEGRKEEGGRKKGRERGKEREGGRKKQQIDI